jgi:hypothetical protein
MTYYQTKTSPLVFTTQKAEKVTEPMLEQMVELLLKREYEMFDPKDAAENLSHWLTADAVFQGAAAPPEKEPTDKEINLFVESLLSETVAGQRWLNQVGQPLHRQTKAEQELLNDETVLSDLLESLTDPPEDDNEGPMMHSRIMGYSEG